MSQINQNFILGIFEKIEISRWLLPRPFRAKLSRFLVSNYNDLKNYMRCYLLKGYFY